MRGVNRTDSGVQTDVQNNLSNKPATVGAITKKTKRSTFGRDVKGAANVEVIHKGPGKQDCTKCTLMPPKPAVPFSPLSAFNSSHSSDASGATASASSETKSATCPSVAEKLKTLGISVVSVKANANERCVTLSYEGNKVILRQNVDDEGKFTNSVGVRANDANREKLHNELGNHKLTFLDLVTKLKPEDAPASGGFFSIFSGLWS